MALARANHFSELSVMTTRPIEVESQKQLFLDDYCIDELCGARRHFHQPKKHPANPLIQSANPKEDIYLHGNVLYDKERAHYRMWYHQRYYGVDGNGSRI